MLPGLSAWLRRSVVPYHVYENAEKGVLMGRVSRFGSAEKVGGRHGGRPSIAFFVQFPAFWRVGLRSDHKDLFFQ